MGGEVGKGREHAGAYKMGVGQTNDETNDRRCREHAGGI